MKVNPVLLDGDQLLGLLRRMPVGEALLVMLEMPEAFGPLGTKDVLALLGCPDRTLDNALAAHLRHGRIERAGGVLALVAPETGEKEDLHHSLKPGEESPRNRGATSSTALPETGEPPPSVPPKPGNGSPENGEVRPARGSPKSGNPPVLLLHTHPETFSDQEQHATQVINVDVQTATRDALVVAWKGSARKTSAENIARCETAAKALLEERFEPADVPKIADFVRQRDQAWRKGPLTPEIIAAEAHGWRDQRATAPPRHGYSRFIATDAQWQAEDAAYQAEIQTLMETGQYPEKASKP